MLVQLPPSAKFPVRFKLPLPLTEPELPFVKSALIVTVSLFVKVPLFVKLPSAVTVLLFVKVPLFVNVPSAVTVPLFSKLPPFVTAAVMFKVMPEVTDVLLPVSVVYVPVIFAVPEEPFVVRIPLFVVFAAISESALNVIVPVAEFVNPPDAVSFFPLIV